MTQPWDDTFEQILRDVLPHIDQTLIVDDLVLAASGMDSMATIEILIRLEQAYEISFPDGLLVASTFATAGSLWRAVCAMRSEAAATGPTR